LFVVCVCVWVWVSRNGRAVVIRASIGDNKQQASPSWELATETGGARKRKERVRGEKRG
jgi:hypothetical protein